MSRIIDGKAISAAVKARIQSEVSALSARGITVGLAVIIVGENPGSKYEKAKTCTFDVFENGEYTLVLETSSGKFLYKEFAISNMDNIPPENVSNVKYTIYPDKHILLSWENPKDSDFTKIKLLINDEKIELNKDVTKYLIEL